jgi:thiol-disulfide isomerase/thioredoxin
LRIKTLLPFVLFLFLSACSESVFVFSDGRQQALNSYKGQWLLINYWAEWCRPCLDELPELNKLNKGEAFQVLGFDFDKAKGELLDSKVKRLGIDFPVLDADPSSMFSQKLPSGLPATMLINKQGKFVKWLMGPQTAESINRHLGLE